METLRDGLAVTQALPGPGSTARSTRVAPAGLDLGRFGDAPAVVFGDLTISYSELSGLVEERAAQLGDTRRLVVIEAPNQLEPLVTYLAALRGGHPALLVPSLHDASPPRQRQWQQVIMGYEPDVTLRRDGDGSWTMDEHRAGTHHDLHPELALLLGTSGSTGSPKLVRLSAESILANSTAIAAYLGLGPHSRAATTLPMHFSYGLSVIHSHLLTGGSIWLTDASVVDAGFFDAFESAGATTFSGVPFTFELLERSGERWWERPTLRQVTVGGGRLAPAKVQAISRSCRSRDVELFLMYGQTEAVSRIAYLPPHLVEQRPGCIGIPVDCGDIRIVDGELVYSGDNVMLGYAESPADLAEGRTVTELYTGDLAVRHDDGIYEITGRRNGIAKLFGTRLDVAVAERLLESHGFDALVSPREDQLDVFVAGGPPEEAARDLLQVELGLPRRAIAVARVPDLPRTTVGKPDRTVLPRLDRPASSTDSVSASFAAVLDRPVHDHDTFVSLGGDSLSFVELYVRLERIVGTLPLDWPQRTVAELAGRSGRRRRFTAVLETPVVLRGLAIVFIVGSHVGLFRIKGGAPVLLALVGYNVSRFVLATPEARDRLRSLGRLIRDLAVPSVLWIGAVALVQGTYAWPTVFLLNGVFGSSPCCVQWNYWFVESALWSALAIGVFACLPLVGPWARAHPFVAPLAALAAALAVRFALANPETSLVETYSVATTGWFAMFGWAVTGARTRWQRVALSLLVPLLVRGFAPDDRPREFVIMAGLLVLIWVPRVVVPRLLAPVIAAVGSASLFIYLTHVQVHPALGTPLTGWPALGALLVCLAFGVAVWRAYAWSRRAGRRGFRALAVQLGTTGERQG